MECPMADFIIPFQRALEKSVDELEASIRQSHQASVTESNQNELWSTFVSKGEDLSDAIEFNERIYQRSKFDLNELVRIARELEVGNRIVIKALEQETGAKLDMVESPAFHGSKHEWESQRESYGKFETICTPQSKRSRSMSKDFDNLSVNSDPRTPTLEDFGITRAREFAVSEMDLMKDEHDLIEEAQVPTFSTSTEENVTDDAEIEPVELRYISNEEMEMLPSFLKHKLGQEELNHFYTIISELACTKGPELMFTMGELEEGTTLAGSQVKAAVLALMKLNRLEAVGPSRYQLVATSNNT